MGAFNSRYSDAVEGKCDRIFDRLGITKKEGQKFFKMFESVDKDHSGSINLDEFFALMDLDWSSFAMKAFQNMDIDKEGAGQNNELEFSEFFVGLWNYCTLERKSLIKFSFDLYDRDGSGSIEMAEMRQLVKAVFGSRKLDEQTMKVMSSIDIDNSGTIRFSEFQAMERKHQSLLFPAFRLQEKMQKQALGVAYWKKATKRRQKAIGAKDIIAMHFSMQHHGQKLDRKQEAMKASVTHQAKIIAEPCYLFGSPNGLGEPVSLTNRRPLPMGKTVTVFEERDSRWGKFYLISGEADEWVKAECARVDSTWDDFATAAERDAAAIALREQHRVEGEARRKAKLAQLSEVWKEAVDKNTGKKYWYNSQTLETSWTDPLGDYR